MMYERRNYTLIATDTSFILQLPVETQLKQVPLMLKSGRVLQPGGCFSEMHGRHTSAGYSQIKVDTPLTYHGIYQCKDGNLACFTQPGRIHQLEMFTPQRTWYYAWGWSEKLQVFLYSTSIAAGRVVETEICR